MGVHPLSTGDTPTAPLQHSQGEGMAGEELNPLEREEKWRARLRPPGETKRDAGAKR